MQALGTTQQSAPQIAQERSGADRQQQGVYVNTITTKTAALGRDGPEARTGETVGFAALGSDLRTARTRRAPLAAAAAYREEGVMSEPLITAEQARKLMNAHHCAGDSNECAGDNYHCGCIWPCPTYKAAATVVALHARLEAAEPRALILQGASFTGCSQNGSADGCNCETWTPTGCANCEREMEDGTEVYELTRVMFPFLAADNSDQEWENYVWHRQCPPLDGEGNS